MVVTSPDLDPDFRCSGASLRDHEPMAGTAPTDVAWLFIEYAGAWGQQAVAESRLPEAVRERLAALSGVRVQLIRRHGGVSGPGVRIFAARLGERPRVWTTTLADHRELLELDLAGLAEGLLDDAHAALTPYDEPLLLVCTNGRRDVCCAELGRPIAATLSAQWPEATWETTHLGGHRFAGTLLHLPSGVVLGRLDAVTAAEACAELEAGRFPIGRVRGRAGRDVRAQVAELHLRAELGLLDVDEVSTEPSQDDVVRAHVAGEAYSVTVRRSEGEPRRQSCSGLGTKPVSVYDVTSWGREQTTVPTTAR